MDSARWLPVVLTLLTAVAPPAIAAEPDEPPIAAQRPGPRQSPAPDFFLGQPRGWVSVRGGLSMPRAGGELFAFVGDQLTLSPGDFRAAQVDLELGFLVGPLLSVEGSFDLSRRSVGSEYRRFVSSTAQPIAQTTRLAQSGAAVGVRFTPSGHGRRISRLAFIPRRLVPYGGAGVLVSHYTFRQQGDFVDFADLSIFPDIFASDGWAAGPYLRGGVDLQVWRRLFVNADVRYAWLRSDLGSDFVGFDGIDLSGARVATGVSVKF